MTNAVALNNLNFVELTNSEMLDISGGLSAWGIASGVFTIVAGAAAVVGGAAALFVPEPVATKIIGYSAITAGISTIAAGASAIMWALE